MRVYIFINSQHSLYFNGQKKKKKKKRKFQIVVNYRQPKALVDNKKFQPGLFVGQPSFFLNLYMALKYQYQWQKKFHT